MRKLFLIIAFLLYIAAHSQEREPKKRGIDFGFQLNNFQSDFSLGLHLNSPPLINGALTLHLRGNIIFYEMIKDAETEWEPYSNILF